MKANKSHALPFVYTGELSIESLTDNIYSNLGADRAIIDGAAGNKIGAYLSVTYCELLMTNTLRVLESRAS